MTDLARFDALVDALPEAALAEELVTIAAWGEPLSGPALKQERVDFIRARRAIRQSDDDIRAEHPEWWLGSDTAERRWRRDRNVVNGPARRFQNLRCRRFEQRAQETP